MKSKTRRRSELVVVALAALSLGAVAVRATSTAGSVEQAKPTIAVGVVDVNRILDALAEREVVMSRLMAEHTSRVKQLEDIAAQIKSTESRLGSLHEDAVTDRQKLAGQLVELQAQYRAKKEVVERLADLDLGREMWPLYLKINDAIGRVGRTSGFDVVIPTTRRCSSPKRNSSPDRTSPRSVPSARSSTPPATRTLPKP